MMSFIEMLPKYDLPALRTGLDKIYPSKVEEALGKTQLDFSDFLALISPAAKDYLERMAQIADAITRRRFGRVILLYAPLYLSNECTNACIYCGFNVHRKFPRVTLNMDEILAETVQLRKSGFKHILLVCGEAVKYVPVHFLQEIITTLSSDFSSLSLEIYPLSRTDYAKVVEAGADGLTLYQESYSKDVYASVHPSGRKKDYGWRLGAIERAGAAGFRRLGIGALLGLNDWRYEAIALALHADYLMKRFWKSQISISFPRLRNAPENYLIPYPVSDAELVQLMLALRIFLHDAGIVISTREPAGLRDKLIHLGVTQMSAGSRTEPGGYLHPAEESAQFKVDDHRSPAEVAAALSRGGYEPVWKDWDKLMHERN